MAQVSDNHKLPSHICPQCGEWWDVERCRLHPARSRRHCSGEAAAAKPACRTVRPGRNNVDLRSVRLRKPARQYLELQELRLLSGINQVEIALGA